MTQLPDIWGEGARLAWKFLAAAHDMRHVAQIARERDVGRDSPATVE
jgi:hypothetical protein